MKIFILHVTMVEVMKLPKEEGTHTHTEKRRERETEAKVMISCVSAASVSCT